MLPASSLWTCSECSPDNSLKSFWQPSLLKQPRDEDFKILHFWQSQPPLLRGDVRLDLNFLDLLQMSSVNKLQNYTVVGFCCNILWLRDTRDEADIYVNLLWHEELYFQRLSIWKERLSRIPLFFSLSLYNSSGPEGLLVHFSAHKGVEQGFAVSWAMFISLLCPRYWSGLSLWQSCVGKFPMSQSWSLNQWLLSPSTWNFVLKTMEKEMECSI